MRTLITLLLTIPFLMGIEAHGFLNEEVTQEEIEYLRLQMDEDFKQEHELDYIIVQECSKDPLAFETAYHSHYKWVEQKNWQRCALIGQAQIRMETQSCTTWMSQTKRNCFGIRNKNSSVFKTYNSFEESIKDWVAHYYDRKTGDYKSTIKEIVYGYYMKDTYWDGQYKWMFGYTNTDKKLYFQFVKNYYNENYLKITDEYFGQD